MARGDGPTVSFGRRLRRPQGIVVADPVREVADRLAARRLDPRCPLTNHMTVERPRAFDEAVEDLV